MFPTNREAVLRADAFMVVHPASLSPCSRRFCRRLGTLSCGWHGLSLEHRWLAELVVRFELAVSLLDVLEALVLASAITNIHAGTESDEGLAQ